MSTARKILTLEDLGGGTGRARVPKTGVGTYVAPVVLNDATGNQVALALNYTTNKATSGDDTGFLINKTDTASPGTSLLADFQVGGVSKVSILANGEINTPQIKNNTATGVLIQGQASGGNTDSIRAGQNGFGYVGLGGYGIVVASTKRLAWGTASSNPSNASIDLALYRGGADTLSQSRTTNPQAFRIYNTTDSDLAPVNYERGFMRWASNVLEIGAEAGGTGTNRDVDLLIGAGNSFNITKGTTRSRLILGNDGNDPRVSSGTTGERLIIDSTAKSTSPIWIKPGLSSPGVQIYGPSSQRIDIDPNTTKIWSFAWTNDLTIEATGRNNVDEVKKALILRGGNQMTTATTNLLGGNLTIVAGAGASASAGLAHGGDIKIDGGQGYGTGNQGAVLINATRTNGLLGFFKAGVAQQAGTGETVGFTAGSGTAANDDSTFTGNVGATAYRISDIVKALKNYGLLAQ